MDPEIHPTAVVEDGAVLGPGCTVAPLALVRAGAVLGKDNAIGPHCTVDGAVRMGSGNQLLPGASLGGAPQDLTYRGEPTLLRLGDKNWIGENVTINRATVQANETIIGNRNYVMSNAHIGHDCQLGDDNVLASSVLIGGAVTIGNKVTFGANAGVHQYCRVGDGAMIGGLCRVTMDVLPFTLMGPEGSLLRLNRVGLTRTGYKGKALDKLREAFHLFCIRRISRDELLNWIRQPENAPADPLLKVWSDFLSAESQRGYARMRKARRR